MYRRELGLRLLTLEEELAREREEARRREEEAILAGMVLERMQYELPGARKVQGVLQAKVMEDS